MSRSTYYNGRFVCDNPNCPTKGSSKKMYVWSDRVSEPGCTECFHPLREVFEEEKPLFNIGKFSNLSTEEKRKVMKKRSHDHFEKNIKQRKDWMDKNYTGREKIPD